MKKSNLLYDVCNQNEIPNPQIKKHLVVLPN